MQEWPEELADELQWLKPADWVQVLEEVRVAKGVQDLSVKSVGILGRLRTSDSAAATNWEYALSPGHRVEQEGNEAYLRAHFDNIVSVEPVVPSNVTTEGKKNLAHELLTKMGMVYTLSVAHDCKVVFRKHDDRKRFRIGDEGTVQLRSDADRKAFQNGDHLKVYVNGKLVNVKPVSVELQGQPELKVFPVMLAYRQTIRMAQSRQKDRWPLILTQEFGGGQYSNLAANSLTFEYGALSERLLCSSSRAS